MNKELDLAELLEDIFLEPSRLRRFLYFLLGESPSLGPSLTNLQSTDSMKSFTNEVVDELRRRGLVNTEFFERLLEEKPEYNERINKVQNDWLINLESWTSIDSLDRHTKSETNIEAPTVFVSYSRRDIDFFEELVTQLHVLQRKGAIRVFHEGRISAGLVWKDILAEQLEQAQIFVLLVSPDFLSSEFVWEMEVKTILERHRRGDAIVIPVIVRNCVWRLAPFADLQVLPEGGMPVTNSTNTDRVWLEIADHIARAAKNLGGSR